MKYLACHPFNDSQQYKLPWSWHQFMSTLNTHIAGAFICFDWFSSTSEGQESACLAVSQTVLPVFIHAVRSYLRMCMMGHQNITLSLAKRVHESTKSKSYEIYTHFFQRQFYGTNCNENLQLFLSGYLHCFHLLMKLPGHRKGFHAVTDKGNSSDWWCTRSVSCW